MKVPANPPTYSKDKGITRRTVKGAAGGMLGVHYEDPRHNDVNTVRSNTDKATAGAGEGRGISAAASEVGVGAGARVARDGAEIEPAGPKEEQHMVLDDEDAATRDAKQRERKMQMSRDRLTIDKDAPELRRTKALWAKIMGEEDDETGEHESESHHAPDPEEIDVGFIGEAIASAGDDAPLDRRQLFAEPGKSYLGDPSLTDPGQIQQVLRTPVAYAKHIMVLSEAFRRTTGAHRPEIIGYMAAMYAALPDRRFARQALKEFGPATGILDVYPLEIVEELVLHYPGSLPKVGFGSLFVRPKTETQVLQLLEGKFSPLTYSESLKIRGFALKGGTNPGYLFEPDEEPGQYRLRIDVAGRYDLIISAITKSGHTIVDRLQIRVRPLTRRPKAMPPPKNPVMARDPAKVQSWPRPVVPPFEISELMEIASTKASESLLSTGELVSKMHEGALRGPMGDDNEDMGWNEAPRTQVMPKPPVPASKEAAPTPEHEPASATETEEATPADVERLSVAEQSFLRIALATQLTSDDLIPATVDSQATQAAVKAFESASASVEAVEGPPVEATSVDAPAFQPPQELAEPVATTVVAKFEAPVSEEAVFSAPQAEASQPDSAESEPPESSPAVASAEPVAVEFKSTGAAIVDPADFEVPSEEVAPPAEIEAAPPAEAPRAPSEVAESAAEALAPAQPEVRVESSATLRPASAPELTAASRAASPTKRRTSSSGMLPAVAHGSPRPRVAKAKRPSSAKPRAHTPAPFDLLAEPIEPLVRPAKPPERPQAPIDQAKQSTLVVRVKDPAAKVMLGRPADPEPGRPDPSVSTAQSDLRVVPLRNPMDTVPLVEAHPPSIGGFLTQRRPTPPIAQGETECEVPAYAEQRIVVTEVVRVRKADTATAGVNPTVRIPIDDLVLDEPE